MTLLQSLLVLLGFAGLLTGEQPGTICPGECDCDTDKMLVDCAGRGLSQIPREHIPNGIRSLVLAGNYISEIDEGALTHLVPWLRSLSLADNDLEDFPDAILSQISSLRTLDLSGNLIVDLPPVTLVSLRELTLSRNDLEYLGADSFHGLARLRELYLGQCSLQSISEGTFSNLPSLKKLSLENNLLDADPVGWFVGTPLQELRLSGNRLPLATAVEKWFGINGTLNFELLALARNEIRFLQKDLFRGLDSLQGLDLRDNRLTSISKNDFLGLKGLKELRLDGNDLTTIYEESLIPTPGLLILTLDRNRLKSLPPLLFESTGSIETLSAASNSFREMSDFDSLPASLVSLNLFNNSFRKLSNIQKFTSLQRLDLSQNQITRIEEGASHLNTELQVIYLDSNALVFLDSQLFEGLQFLHTLTLSGNPWWCDCRLVWMQDIMWSMTPPQWAENLAEEIVCSKPEGLKGRYLQDIELHILQQQCPNLQFGVALIAAISAWFVLLGIVIARFWIRKYTNIRKFKKHARKNTKYNLRRNRRRKQGVSEWPSHILPLAPLTGVSIEHRQMSFPLQRRGHVYFDLDGSDPCSDSSLCENGRYSETVV